MINFLKNRMHTNELCSSSLFSTIRYEYDQTAIQYFKEIPPNFINLQYDRDKKGKITKHLNSIYEEVSNETIDRVLMRVMNLIRYVSSNNRKDYEDFTGQYIFKEKYWKKIKRCQMCGKKFIKISDASLEHVLPISLGGSDNDSNWQLLCTQCNQNKSSFWGLSDCKLVDQFISKDILKSRTTKEIIDRLHKSIKYFILEKDSRKCTNCCNTTETSQLQVVLLYNTMINIDSFITLCDSCIKSQKIKKDNLL